MGHVLAPEPTTEAGAVQSRRTRVSTGSFLSAKAGSGAEGHVVAPNPSWMARGEGSEPLDTWQRRSPPRRREGIQSLEHVAVSEPSLNREAGSGTAVARDSVWTHTLPFVLG
jgi:hypothetical protein